MLNLKCFVSAYDVFINNYISERNRILVTTISLFLSENTPRIKRLTRKSIYVSKIKWMYNIVTSLVCMFIYRK